MRSCTRSHYSTCESTTFISEGVAIHTAGFLLRHSSDNTIADNTFRVALAFQNLTPIEVCQAFERALNRPCRYVYTPTIEIRVPIPSNYREQLHGIEELFGRFKAPYFPGTDFDFPDSHSESRRDSGTRRNGERPQLSAAQGTRGSSSSSQSRPKRLTSDARRLWPGFRRIEDYAREAFPIEEEANGKTWMTNKSINT